MQKTNRTRYSTAISAFALTTALCLVPTGRASAQNEQPSPPPATQDSANNSGLSDIIVTAQKRSENSQKVPIAISAFSAETLKAANVEGLSDLANVTPSLNYTFQSQSGSPFLRGVGNSQTFAGAEAEVQTYIDNVYYASGGGAYSRFNNIERVEIDKGPQGTLFGRNATGGVIQIFTRDPSHTPHLDLSAGYGNFDAKDADLYATTGFGDKLAGDIAVHYDDRGGWGKNTVDGSDVYNSKSFAVRSKWVYNPSSVTKITLIGDYGVDKSNLGQAYGVVAAPWGPGPGGPAPTGAGFYDVSSDYSHLGKTTQYGGSVKVDTKVGNLSFVSISAYRDTKSIGFIDADHTPTPFLYGFDKRNEKQASQEFQLLSPTTGRFQWIVGTFLYYNKASELPALSGAPFARLGADRVDNYSSETTKSAAAFGQATYNVTPTTHVTVGLRYTHDHRSQDADIIFQYPNGPGAPPPFLGLGVNDYPHASFNALTGKVTVSQDLGEHALVYAGYNRGFKSGIFNNIDVLQNPGPALQPEHMNAYEGGFKADFFDHRVRFNAAAFLYKYTNLQVDVFQNINIALENAASSTIKGIDGSVEFAATHDTRFQIGFSFLDAKYDKFADAPLYLINPVTSPNLGGGGYGGLNITSGSANGHILPYAPKRSGFASVNQRVHLGESTIDLNATVKYQSRTYFTPDNLYSQSGYATLSASAKWVAPGANGMLRYGVAT